MNFTLTARAQIFVLNGTSNSIGEYNANTGSTINSSLASTGMNSPNGIALYGSDILASNYGNSTISEYTSTGTLITSSFLTSTNGLNGNSDIIVSGNDLFVGNGGAHDVVEYNLTTKAVVETFSASTSVFPHGMALSGGDLYVSLPTAGAGSTIAEYNASTGTLITSSFINSGTGSGDLGIAISGGDLYVAESSKNAIYEFNASTGAQIGSGAFISGLNDPFNIQIVNGDLFVTNLSGNSVGEYNATTGATINASFLTGLSGPTDLAIIPQVAPEPLSWAPCWNPNGDGAWPSNARSHDCRLASTGLKPPARLI